MRRKPGTIRRRFAPAVPIVRHSGGPFWRVQFRVDADAATYATLQARARTEKREISEIARTALERYLHGEPANG